MTEYRVDELARASGVSVRNVRVYQDRGLLPPPRREGRTGWYGDSHVTRLRLISRMLDRGYTFATIRELLTAAQYGLRVEDVLNPEPADRQQTLPKNLTFSRSELEKLFGSDIADADLDLGVELGVTVRSGTKYTVVNPALFEAARVLSTAGISLADTLQRTAGARDDLDDIADRFVTLVADTILPGIAEQSGVSGAESGERSMGSEDPFEMGSAAVSAVAELIETLKPLAQRVVDVMFVQAMDRRIEATMSRVVDQFGDEPAQKDQAI